MKKYLFLAGFLPIFFFGVSSLQALPGDLRSDFGVDGSLVMDLETNDFMTDLVTDPNDHITVLTQSSLQGAFQLSFDGALETGFGSWGIYQGHGGHRLLRLSDGNFLVASYYTLVNRITAAGGLDSTFYFQPPATYMGFLTADILEQPDGRVLVLGQETEQAGALEVHRLQANGSYDTSFARSGAFPGIFKADDITDIMPSRLALQADGKILVSGAKIVGGYDHFFVGRLTADGAWDTSFGPDHSGHVVIVFQESRNERVGDLKVQADGKILIAGGVWLEDRPGLPKYLALARLTRSGFLDSTWSRDRSGRITIPTERQETAMIWDLLPQFNGKILYVASSGGILSSDLSQPFELGRLKENGAFDTRFGRDGTGRVRLGGRLGEAMAMDFDSDCSVVVGGLTNYDPNTSTLGSDRNIFLARFETGLERFCY